MSRPEIACHIKTIQDETYLQNQRIIWAAIFKYFYNNCTINEKATYCFCCKWLIFFAPPEGLEPRYNLQSKCY